ncbi:hypothetical protein FJY68_01070 [candidate division WOR-3 bacterium]|uniref:MnmG N-terminal domain-containing protein n=1 Tax=candidate division WOR-3 bacterium TaxID=2052148 RepID=A0A937XBM8_UNCW3|nr:hypothetical protein [candidate division WOR-3 bacterium]
MQQAYDVIVVGAGHAGVEAALARSSARSRLTSRAFPARGRRTAERSLSARPPCLR